MSVAPITRINRKIDSFVYRFIGIDYNEYNEINFTEVIMTPKQQFYQNQAQSIIKKLEQRSMAGYYCATREEAKTKALELMTEKTRVAWGGSKTLQEIGLLESLEKKDFIFAENASAKTPDEKRQSSLDELNSDYYLMSTNAITMDGQLVNVDGNGNRVAALIFGPKNVIVIAGMNKVAADIDAAIWRVRNIAAPPNTLRLNKKTPCTETGKCHDCLTSDCICCQTVITRKSRVPGRIQVILVGEELGF